MRRTEIVRTNNFLEAWGNPSRKETNALPPAKAESVRRSIDEQELAHLVLPAQ